VIVGHEIITGKTASHVIQLQLVPEREYTNNGYCSGTIRAVSCMNALDD
jgi:hypothetical protein